MGRTTFLKWVSKRAVHYKQQILKMDGSHFTKEKVETQRQGESVPVVTQLLRPRNGSPDPVFGACSLHVCSQPTSHGKRQKADFLADCTCHTALKVNFQESCWLGSWRALGWRSQPLLLSRVL